MSRLRDEPLDTAAPPRRDPDRPPDTGGLPGSTRWLDEAETAAWVALAGMAAALPAALDSQLQRDAGIGFVDYQVLSWLSMAPARTARMSVVAEMATISQSHACRVVARLERRGWVRRVPDPDDGRGTLAELTEAGWRTVVAAAPGHVSQVQRLVFDNLSATQVAHLEQIGRRVLGAIHPGHCMRVPIGVVVDA